ncbi:hypothetical protein [Cohnella sp. OV330]|uniref:hypothetical protein n=1 Tax=Cohnella sp. OV330 TaxID=1855288 RepID=UPI0011603893|nr:hypothetical protein [Cohnella sp. OV330]
MEINQENGEAKVLGTTSSVVAAKPKSLYAQPLFLVVTVLTIVALIGVGLLYQKNTRLQDDLNAQQIALDGQSQLIKALTEKTDSYITQISDIENRAQSIAKIALLASIQHEVEGGIVTDDFVVNKLYLTPTNDGKVSVIIDLDTQPQMALHYKGQGGFDLADRELRAKSTTIIEKVKGRYQSYAPDDLPAWNDADVNLTIKNYAIGDTTSGQFALVGEK